MNVGSIVVIGLGVLAVVVGIAVYVLLTADPHPGDLDQ